MSNAESVTHWLRSLKSGDEEAAGRLWERYFGELIQFARERMGESPRRVADEEDVALSVFRHLCEGAARGQFSKLDNRVDLRHLLVAITAHKVVDHRRLYARKKRGDGRVRGDSVFKDGPFDDIQKGFDQLIGKGPTPEFLATLAEEHERLMEMLDSDVLRQVAQGKMEGFTNGEIADRLNLSRRSIERKLQWIRRVWVTEVES